MVFRAAMDLSSYEVVSIEEDGGRCWLRRKTDAVRDVNGPWGDAVGAQRSIESQAVK